MKILIFYTYNKGLLSSFFQELSKKLYGEGHDVVNYFLKNKKEEFVQDGVLIYGEKRGTYFSNYYNIYHIINRVKPDVILSNFSYVNPALFFGKLLGVKRNIVWFHTVYGHSKPSRLKVVNKSLFLKLANKVITNSSLLDVDMISKYGVKKEKLYCVPFWTNICSLTASPIDHNFELQKRFKIGCPGRLVNDKNHELVINAVHRLVNQNMDMVLYIAGDGPYKSNLEQLVKKLDLENHVVFLGLLSSNQMVTFYKSVDLVILPSRHEAFGLVFIEAVALGTAVLVSSQFGSLSFIDTEQFNIDPFVFNPYNCDDLVNKMTNLIAENTNYNQFFRKLYDHTFEKERIFNRLKSILLE